MGIRFFLVAMVVLTCGCRKSTDPAYDPKFFDRVTAGDLVLAAEMLEARPGLALGVDPRGQTPLHVAALEGQVAIVDLLLSKNVPIGVRDGLGGTPLDGAVLEGHAKVVDLLVSRGADVNGKDRFGKTPLHVAASLGHEAVVEVLLSRGADVNARTTAKDPDGVGSQEAGWTPLHAATVAAGLYGKTGAMSAILARRPAVDAKTEDGHTALHLTALYGWNAVAEPLLTAGASVDVKDNDGKTALALAQDRANTVLVSILKRHGARE